jgi:hypothetical protein
VKKIIDIAPNGKMTFIHDDQFKGLLSQGKATITRASHVEPGDPAKGQDPLKWYADMAPSNGPILGPFETRQEALDQETTWINENVLTPKLMEPIIDWANMGGFEQGKLYDPPRRLDCPPIKTTLGLELARRALKAGAVYTYFDLEGVGNAHP